MLSPGQGRATLASDLDEARATLGQVAARLEQIQASADRQPSGLQPLVPVRVAAAWVGMTERGFRKLIERGLVPAAKVGKRYVVLVDEWLAKLRSESSL